MPFSSQQNAPPLAYSENAITELNAQWEKFRELLRTTHNWYIIKHICCLFPDTNICPATVLSERWDPRLDSFLIRCLEKGSFRNQQNEILNWAADQKATKLLRHLRWLPGRANTVWHWSWTPLETSEDPCAIAADINDQVHGAFFRVPFREWLSYLDGSEGHGVVSFWKGIYWTRDHLHQRMDHLKHPRDKFEAVEKHLHLRHPVSRWIVENSLVDKPAHPQYALKPFFNQIRSALAHEDTALVVKRLAILAKRYEVLANSTETNYDWGILSSDFSFLERISYEDPKKLAESITDNELVFFLELRGKDCINRSQIRSYYGMHWSALNNHVYECVDADGGLVDCVTEVVTHLLLSRNFSSMTAMLSGIKKAHISSPELLILFRFIDPDDNYSFYRKESSKKPRLPFLLPYVNAEASTEDPGIALARILQYATYPTWRRQMRELAERESVQITWGHLGGVLGILHCAFVWLRCLLGVRDHQIQHSDTEKAQQQNSAISVFPACSHEPQRALPGDLASLLDRSTILQELPTLLTTGSPRTTLHAFQQLWGRRLFPDIMVEPSEPFPSSLIAIFRDISDQLDLSQHLLVAHVHQHFADNSGAYENFAFERIDKTVLDNNKDIRSIASELSLQKQVIWQPHEVYGRWMAIIEEVRRRTAQEGYRQDVFKTFLRVKKYSFYDPISVAEFCVECIKDTKQGLRRGVVRHWIQLRGCEDITRSVSKLNDMVVRDTIRDVSHWKSGLQLAIISFTGFRAFEEHVAIFTIGEVKDQHSKHLHCFEVGLNYLRGCADRFGDSLAADEIGMLQKCEEWVFWNQGCAKRIDRGDLVRSELDMVCCAV